MMQKPTKWQISCGAAICFSTFFFLVDYYFWCESLSSPSQIDRLIVDPESTGVELEVRPKIILASHKLTPSPDNVFFVETSCAGRRREPRGLVLNSKQACAIYSAAFYNPSKKITLVYTCPLLRNYYTKSSEVVKTLFDLPNFAVAHIALPDLYAETPLSSFLNGILRKSAYPVEHNADILRILLVYLFGGTYMDLDVVSTRPLDGLGTNFIGAQEFAQLGTGIFNFDAYHAYTKQILSKAFQAYDPTQWAAVGPVLATKVLRDFCNIKESTNLETVGFIPSCNITVCGYQVFYPIRYSEWKLYYAYDSWPTVEARLNETYVVHVWNHMSGNNHIVVGSEQPYGKLAEQHCTPVYAKSGLYFR